MITRRGVSAIRWLALCSALAACTAQSPDPRVEQFARLPEWRGIWAPEGQVAGVSGFSQTVPLRCNS